MQKHGMLLKTIMDEAADLDPNGKIEVYSDRPNHPDAKLTWRIRVPGRGVYMGEAMEVDVDGEKWLALDDAHTFIPENSSNFLMT